jgi:hypothetical protein
MQPAIALVRMKTFIKNRLLFADSILQLKKHCKGFSRQHSFFHTTAMNKHTRDMG